MNSADDPLQSFLKAQLPKALRLAEASEGRVEIQPEPADPPAAYMIHLHARGYVRDLSTGGIRLNEHWTFLVRFGEDYLRFVRPGEVVGLLAPFGRVEAWHPNLRGPLVCLGVKPGMDIERIVWAIHDLITGHNFRAEDPLNPAAAEWLRNNPSAFPADRRPLVRGNRQPPSPATP